MSKRSRQIHRETAMTVGTGLIINYPLNLFCLFICLSVLQWTDPLMIGTTITAFMTIVAYCRVYIIRRYFTIKSESISSEVANNVI